MKRLFSKAVSFTAVLCLVLNMCTAVHAITANELTGHWAEETLREWVELGLLKGDKNGMYNPDAIISRAEFMALVNRVMNFTAKSEKIRSFTDVSPGKWYYEDASKALAAGYITGTSADTLSPEGTLTREQAITIISRIKELVLDGNTEILALFSDSGELSVWARGPVAQAIREGLVFGSNGRINPKADITRCEAIVLLDRVRKTLPAFPSVTPIISAAAGSVAKPTAVPSKVPTAVPTPTTPGLASPPSPTVGSNTTPTTAPDAAPTTTPTTTPTVAPTSGPAANPTAAPTTAPTVAPTSGPAANPTAAPTTAPTITPTAAPTIAPITPTAAPSSAPTPGVGFTLTVHAENGYVMVHPEKDVYTMGETVELFTRPEAGYSFGAWSGDLSGHRLRETIVMDGSKTVTATFNRWTAPVGIPEPEFGIFEDYRMYDEPARRNPELTYHQNAEGGYYTHYVDNTHPAATDKNNTYGTADKPRLTLPAASSVLPGSVVEFHGGPYSMKYTIYRVDGTSNLPIFIRGYSQTDRVELNGGDIYINSSWMIMENFKRINEGICVRSFIDRQTHHVCLRNNDTAGLSALSWDGGVSKDIVFYGNYNNSQSFDPDAGGFQEKDGGGIGINLGSDRVWIVDNHITLAGGDASGGGHAANYTAKNYFIGRNIMHTCGENAIDIKEVDTAIVSQNIMYDFQGWSGGSNGTAIVLHYGPTWSPKNVWLLYNEIFNCKDVAIQVGGDQEYPVYIIGNVVHDIHNDSGSGKGFTTWGCREVYFTNNVIDDVDNGVDWGVQGTNAKMVFNNNIVSNTTEAGYALRVEAASQRQNAVINANLFYQQGGSSKIRWGSTNYTVTEFQQISGKGAGSMDADPMFVAPQKGDYRLQAGSPAIDKGHADEIYQIFEDCFGIDIRIDALGITRPQGGQWDLGAYEHTGAATLINKAFTPTMTTTPQPIPTPTQP